MRLTHRQAPGVDFIACERHFVDHMAPIWHALDPEARGRFYCGRDDHYADVALLRARTLGIDARPGWLPTGSLGLAVVSAIGDLGKGRHFAPRKRFVFAEHGCGISYEGRRSSYVGSDNRPNVDLILVPNDVAGDRQRKGTPNIEVVTLGSSPRLDPWAPGMEKREAWEAPDPPVVALSFHWDSGALMETRSALSHYRRGLDSVLDRPWEVIGHSHPRIWSKAKVTYRHWGIEPVREFDEVLERASIYVVDNSSTLYEFAATGRPVVVMNCPYYRRDVHHGLRFWDAIPGPQVEGPEHLPNAISLALSGDDDVERMRRDAVDVVYPRHDGGAAFRAAAAIEALWGDVKRTTENPLDKKIDVWAVVDPEGAVVAEYLTQYEAKSHAAAKGLVVQRGQAAAGVSASPVRRRGLVS